MDSSIILRFIILTAVIEILLDVYVNMTWRRFVHRRQWNIWWSHIVWILSAVVFAASVFSGYSRMTSGTMGEWGMATQYAMWLWYLPKLPIVLVLLIKDKFRLLRWGWRKTITIIFRKQARVSLSSSSASVNLSPLKEELSHSGEILVSTPSKGSASSPENASNSRRDFLQKAGWAMAGVPFIVVTNGMFRTLYDFRVEQVMLPIKGLPPALEGLRILQISDIHAGSFGSERPFAEVGRLIREQKPDVIVVTGDFVNSRPDELPTVYRELELLKAPLGVFGSLGNHDHFMTPENHAVLTSSLQKTAVDLLVNEHRIISIDGAKLAIAGTDNTGFNQHYARLDEALAGIEPGVPTILLAHDPTFWDKEVQGKTSVDAMLSGHTHGGQVAFHIPGMTISPAQIVFKQWAGLYRNGEQLLYVNRGIGTVGPPVRIGVPPEVTVFTLARAETRA